MNMKGVLKWIPVALAGVVAVCQGIEEQRAADRIDDMESRLAKLEESEEEA